MGNAILGVILAFMPPGNIGDADDRVSILAAETFPTIEKCVKDGGPIIAKLEREAAGKKFKLFCIDTNAVVSVGHN